MQEYVRVALVFCGIISIFIFPTWVPMLCVIALSLRHRAWEAILIGVLIDLTWLPSGNVIHALPIFTLLSLVIVWGFEPLRAQFLLSE